MPKKTTTFRVVRQLLTVEEVEAESKEQARQIVEGKKVSGEVLCDSMEIHKF